MREVAKITQWDEGFAVGCVAGERRKDVQSVRKYVRAGSGPGIERIQNGIIKTYLRGRLDEGEAEERVAAVLQKLLQGNDKTPRVRTMDDESLQQHTNNLLADVRLILLRVVNTKQTQDGEAKEVGVAVGVSQLVGHRAQQVVTSLGLHCLGKFLQKSGMVGVLEDASGIALRCVFCSSLLANVQNKRVD